MNDAKSFSFRKFLAKVAFAGFGLSLLFHLMACLGVNVTDSFPFVWLLHLGIFVVFVPMGMSTLLESGNAMDKGVRYNWFASIPRKARLLAGIFFIYAILNFMLFVALNQGGSPEILNGEYVLYSGGRVSQRRVIREISKAEYDLMQAEILRGFSGGWMIFYLVPALHFGYFRSSDEVKERVFD